MRLEGEADTRCVEPACPYQRDQRIIYFASRGAMDIEGLGERTVAPAHRRPGSCADPADIYSLTARPAARARRLRPGQCRQAASPRSTGRGTGRCRGCSRRSGIKHLGPAAAQALAAHFGTLDAVVDGVARRSWPPSTGVGPIIAASIATWFALAPNREFIEKLRAAGVDFGVARAVERPRLPQVLAGKAVVVSGTLDGYTPRGGRGGDRRPRRQEPRQRRARRPTPSSSATSPARARSTKAEQVGVPILDEAAFERLLETGER